jgi:hypothetical protein
MRPSLDLAAALGLGLKAFDGFLWFERFQSLSEPGRTYRARWREFDCDQAPEGLA